MRRFLLLAVFGCASHEVHAGDPDIAAKPDLLYKQPGYKRL
jgi:hypothetical protein